MSYASARQNLKFAYERKIKSVGIRPRCVRVNHTWRSEQFCRFFSFTRSRSQASSTSSSALLGLQEFISAVTNLARDHAARADRTIEDLMERLEEQELRHQQVVDAVQNQVAAVGAIRLLTNARQEKLPFSQKMLCMQGSTVLLHMSFLPLFSCCQKLSARLFHSPQMETSLTRSPHIRTE